MSPGECTCNRCYPFHSYVATATGCFGYVGVCMLCGWRSEEHATPRDAQTAVAAHLCRVRTPEPEAAS